MQTAKKAIPLVRTMALSMLAGWLFENGAQEQAKEAAVRCLSEIVWEDAFSFSARLILALSARQEGKEETYSAHRLEMERYHQDRQLDWCFLPDEQRSCIDEILRQDDSPGERIKIKVACFGRFQVRLPEETEEARWRTRKAQELFAFLFHLQGQPVDKETILLRLWPETDKESATSLLHTTLYSIRKMLAGYRLDGMIVYDKKKYMMNMDYVSSDLDQINQLCRALSLNDESFIYNCRNVLNSYLGDYLGGIACDFTVAPRAYYEQKFLQLIDTASRKCMEREQWDEAVSLLDMAINVDPFEEKLYHLVLQCFQELKDVKRAKAYYTRLRTVLREELEIEPSAEVYYAYRLCLEATSDKMNVQANR